SALVTGFKVEAVLAALGISLPAVQVLELSNEPRVRQLLAMAQEMVPPLEMNVQLPEALYWMSGKRLNNRFREGRSFRDTIAEVQWSRAIYYYIAGVAAEDRFGNDLTLAASGGIYVGAGRLLEMTAFESDDLARRGGHARPLFIHPLESAPLQLDDQLKGAPRWATPRTEEQLLERKRLITDGPTPIWDWRRQLIVMDATRRLIRKMIEIRGDEWPELPDYARELHTGAGTYNWMVFLCSNKPADIYKGIVIAEDLPLADGADMLTLVQGPLSDEVPIKYFVDPQTQPQSAMIGRTRTDLELAAQDLANDAEAEYQRFVQEFHGHFRPVMQETPSKEGSDTSVSTSSTTTSSSVTVAPAGPAAVSTTTPAPSTQATATTSTPAPSTKPRAPAADSGVPVAATGAPAAASGAPATIPKTPAQAATTSAAATQPVSARRRSHASPPASEPARSRRETRRALEDVPT
ncbi:MAG: protein product from transcript, partial [bacterium]